MIDYLLAWGGIYLPMGFVFWVLAVDKGGTDAWFFFICGVVLVALGLVAMSKAWDKVKTQEKKEEERFKELITEIRGLRQDSGAKGAKEDGE